METWVCRGYEDSHGYSMNVYGCGMGVVSVMNVMGLWKFYYERMSD